MSFTLTDDLEPPRITPAVQWIIALNVVVYFVQMTVIDRADIQAGLGFHVRDLTEQPWTVLTYMFVHGDILHILFNMYSLWLFGRRVEYAWNPRSFAFYYLWCGLGAWLLHLMVTRDATLIGASGAVYGVMLAYAMRWPNEEILFMAVIPMKVKWLVVGLAVFDLARGLGLVGGPSNVAYFAHLGGFAFGWLYLRWISAGVSLDRLRERMSQLPDVPDEPPRAIPRSRPRDSERREGIDEVIARSNKALAASRRPAISPPVARPRDAKADALDRVLDKINEKGLSSLTSEERKLLEEMSKKLKDR
jgi:membrane associated rhomboid family serine protease